MKSFSEDLVTILKALDLEEKTNQKKAKDSGQYSLDRYLLLFFKFCNFHHIINYYVVEKYNFEFQFHQNSCANTILNFEWIKISKIRIVKN